VPSSPVGKSALNGDSGRNRMVQEPWARQQKGRCHDGSNPLGKRANRFTFMPIDPLSSEVGQDGSQRLNNATEILTCIAWMLR